MGNAQNGVVDLGRFSLDNMEVLSLYNGQKSAMLQTAKDYASASAVYMTTRTPHFEGESHYTLNVGMKAGSFALANPSILWEQRLTHRISLSVGSEYMYTSGRYKFTYSREGGYDTTAVRRNGDVRMWRLESGLYGRLSGGEWRVRAYYYRSERGYPGASVREVPGRFPHEDRQWDDNFFVQGSLKQTFAEWYCLQLNAKYAHDYLHYLSDPRKDVSTMFVDNRYLQQESYLSVAHLFGLKKWWRVSWANDFLWNTLDADLYNFAYPNRYALLSAVATSIDLHGLNVQASLLHSFYDDRTQAPGASAGTKSRFTPSIVAAWQPNGVRNLHLRAFYKQIFRMPTLNDLYYTFIGNKELRPEYTKQYDVGITYGVKPSRGALQYIECQVDGYYNVVDDKIVAMPTANQFRWTMLNLGHVRIVGVDVVADALWRVGKVDLATRASYTYQQAQDRTDRLDEWYGGQIPYIPWHSGSLVVGCSYKGWSLDYSFIYTGRRYTARANIAENYKQPWYTHDLGVTRTFHLGKCDLCATAEVNNLLNRHYEVVQCYPMPGTNVKLKINILL